MPDSCSALTCHLEFFLIYWMIKYITILISPYVSSSFFILIKHAQHPFWTFDYELKISIFNVSFIDSVSAAALTPRICERYRSVLVGFVESEATQAHFILPIPGWGDRFSCRQIIHGDFILNEVKLLLSAKRLFQKSLPGLELLLYVPLPFVGLHGRVTWPRMWQALDSKEKPFWAVTLSFKERLSQWRCVQEKKIPPVSLFTFPILLLFCPNTLTWVNPVLPLTVIVLTHSANKSVYRTITITRT